MSEIISEEITSELFDPKKVNKRSLTSNKFSDYDYSEEACSSDNPDQVAIIHYRGYNIPLYNDDPGQQFYCKLDGEEFGFGAFNFSYKDDIMFLVDSKLDDIYHFENYWGAKLSWFINGRYRDIQLTYRSRILKVFPTFDGFILTEQVVKDLVEDSNRILPKFIKK